MANMSFTSHCVQYLSLFPGALFWGKFALLISRIFSFSTFSFSRKYHEFRRKLWRFFFEGRWPTCQALEEGRFRESWVVNQIILEWKKTIQLQADGFWRSLWITFLAKCQKKKRSQAGVAISRPPSRFLLICCCGRHLGCPFALQLLSFQEQFSL